MPYLGLDVCGPPDDPNALVADMRAMGARLVGLYVYNSSASFCVRSASYIAAVERAWGGPCVLPILTIATGDNPGAARVSSLLQQYGMQGRRVGHDVETYAFPGAGVLRPIFQAERELGCSPGIYCFDRTQPDYGAAGPDWWWGVWGYAEDFGYLPAGHAMWQYYNLARGPVTGAEYDVSTVADDFSVLVSVASPAEYQFFVAVGDG